MINHLGWGAHREPARLKSPGQTRHLEAMGQNGGQGDGWIALDWKRPDEGGKAAAYKIQRREGDAETWLDAGRQPWIPKLPSPTNRAASAWSSGPWPSTRPAMASRVMGCWRRCEGGRGTNPNMNIGNAGPSGFVLGGAKRTPACLGFMRTLPGGLLPRCL
uniref:Uncharacterized protein n=1 Tax=Candidatus Kentrum sp. LFY TaxID=2126342 RepID=A0A450X494_9GAMM|nr:MAG: hypothetical protein BECKLFY1418C_GA0070996_11685 [Candidatus Kentron sp. LFY]